MALIEVITNAIDSQKLMARVEISLHSDVNNGTVVVSIRDNGTGVPHHLSENVFQPFFTTKENHSGLGLTRTLRWMSFNAGYVYFQPGAAGAELILAFPAGQKVPESPHA